MILLPTTAGKLYSKFAPHKSHLPERMGLFTLIVLGESIVGIVTGMTEQVWDVYSVIEHLWDYVYLLAFGGYILTALEDHLYKFLEKREEFPYT